MLKIAGGIFLNLREGEMEVVGYPKYGVTLYPVSHKFCRRQSVNQHSAESACSVCVSGHGTTGGARNMINLMQSFA